MVAKRLRQMHAQKSKFLSNRKPEWLFEICDFLSSRDWVNNRKMINIEKENDNSCVKAYFSSDSHSVGEKRGAACFHNTLSFALHGIWRALYYLFEVSKYKRTKNKGIIGTTQVEILIYWTGANTCFSAQICIGIVLDYSWDMFMYQEKLQTMSTQNFGGVKEVHYGIVQVVNWDGLGVDTANALWQ